LAKAREAIPACSFLVKDIPFSVTRSYSKKGRTKKERRKKERKSMIYLFISTSRFAILLTVFVYSARKSCYTFFSFIFSAGLLY